MIKEVFIVGSKRTPIGSFQGQLSTFSAPQLAQHTIVDALKQANLNTDKVDEVILGNVLSANIGQAPSNQASILAGIPTSVPCTTINKVCASGMKAVMIGAMNIELENHNIIVTGGMESMSQVPYYLDKARNGYRLGHQTVVDGIIKDGLWDPYSNFHMGNAAELCSSHYKLGREKQDEFALQSYEKAQSADKNKRFQNEITPLLIKDKKSETLISSDEEIYKLKKEKLPELKPAFDKAGVITAANASKINDGAACLVLASAEGVEKNNLKPLAKVIGYADASQAPEWFTTSPALAVQKLLQKSKLQLKDIDFFEINEAFSCVVLANQIELKIPSEKINVWGGAVALGHPIGCSGARIITTLISILKHHNAKYGCASICNGGGGASAILIENIN